MHRLKRRLTASITVEATNGAASESFAMSIRRQRSVTQRQGPCPDDPACAGLVEVADVTVPTGDINPASDVPVEITLRNHAQRIGATDDDRCGSATTSCTGGGLFSTAGLCIRMHVIPSWSSEQTPVTCSRIGIPAPNQKTAEVVLPAPNVGGDQTVRVWIELEASGTGVANSEFSSTTIERTISFQEGADPACTTNADCPGDQVCDAGRCVEPSNGGDGLPDVPGGISTGAIVALLAVILILAVAQ